MLRERSHHIIINIPVPVVVAELEFFEVEGELLWIYPMEFLEPFFSKGPETFDSVDIHLAVDEPYPMVDPPVTEAIGDEAIIAPELIGVDEAPPFHLLDGHLEESFTLNILHHFNPDLSSPFQDAEDRDLASSSPSPFSFSSPAEVRFIHLDLAGEGKSLGVDPGYRFPEEVEEVIDGVVGKVKLPCRFSHRCIQLEELDGHEDPRCRYPRPGKDTPPPRAPLPPAFVAFELAPTDPANPRTLTERTLIKSFENPPGPEILSPPLLTGCILL